MFEFRGSIQLYGVHFFYTVQSNPMLRAVFVKETQEVNFFLMLLTQNLPKYLFLKICLLLTYGVRHIYVISYLCQIAQNVTSIRPSCLLYSLTKPEWWQIFSNDMLHIGQIHLFNQLMVDVLTCSGCCHQSMA